MKHNEAVQDAMLALRQLADGQPLQPHHAAAVERGLRNDHTGIVIDALISYSIKHGTRLADELLLMED
jgi:hypothetical protein